MSVRDYLHEKAEESRHNEMFAYLMFIAGAVFFVGGVLETITTTSNPEWFLFFPYHVTATGSSILGLALTLVGITLLIYGVVMGIYHGHDRAWYMKELRRAHSVEVGALNVQKRRKIKAVAT